MRNPAIVEEGVEKLQAKEENLLNKSFFHLNLKCR